MMRYSPKLHASFHYHDVWKCASGNRHIDYQHCLIASRIQQIFSRDRLAPEQPAQAASVQLAPHKGLLAKVIPKRLHETLIGPFVRPATIRISDAFRQCGRAVFAGAPQSKLKVRAR